MNRVQSMSTYFNYTAKSIHSRKQLKKTISAALKSSIIFSPPVLTEHRMLHNEAFINTFLRLGNPGWTASPGTALRRFSSSICATSEILVRRRSGRTQAICASLPDMFPTFLRGLSFGQPICGGEQNRAGSPVVKLSQISPDIVRGYLASVYKTLEKTSRARKLSALRSFYHYLNSAGIFSENPADLVAHPRIKQKTPSFLQVDSSLPLSGRPLARGPSARKLMEEGPQLGHVRIDLLDRYPRERTCQAEPFGGGFFGGHCSRERKRPQGAYNPDRVKSAGCLEVLSFGRGVSISEGKGGFAGPFSEFEGRKTYGALG